VDYPADFSDRLFRPADVLLVFVRLQAMIDNPLVKQRLGQNA
jgi:hypothetical protein